MAGLGIGVRVLVTGHAGYIGSVLVPMLLDRGHDVVGCDVGLFDRCRFPGTVATVPNLARDIRTLSARDMIGLQAVIHLAGLSNDPLGYYQPELTLEVNCESAFRTARAAREAGATRFLFASSCSVYGGSTDELLTEDAVLAPVTPYGESKCRAEMAIGTLANDDFSPVYLRAGTVYGVSPRIRFDLVLNNLTAWAVATGEVRLKSDGSAWRPMIHVADLSRAYVSMLEAPRELVHNEPFNIGTTRENYRIRDLARIIVKTVTGSCITSVAGAVADHRNYRVDCGKFERLFLESANGRTVVEGAAELLSALRLYPVGPEEFEGRQFSRIAHVHYLVQNGHLDPALYWAPNVARMHD